MLFDNSIHENAEKVNIKNKKTAAQKSFIICAKGKSLNNTPKCA